MQGECRTGTTGAQGLPGSQRAGRGQGGAAVTGWKELGVGVRIGGSWAGQLGREGFSLRSVDFGRNL